MNLVQGFFWIFFWFKGFGVQGFRPAAAGRQKIGKTEEKEGRKGKEEREEKRKEREKEKRKGREGKEKEKG